MDYDLIYRAFIADRGSRPEPPREVSDVHHIRPRCLGGCEAASNKIRLTYADHLFAHVLLARIHGGVLIQCAVRMSGMAKYNGGRVSRQRYGYLREMLRRKMLGNTHCVGRVDTPETLRKRAESLRIAHATPETRERMRVAREKPETKIALSEASKKRWAKPGAREKEARRMAERWNNPDYREAQAARMRGKQHALGHKQSDEAKAKKSAASKASWARGRRGPVS